MTSTNPAAAAAAPPRDIHTAIKSSSPERLVGLFQKYEHKWDFEVTEHTALACIREKLALTDDASSEAVEQAFQNTVSILMSIGFEFVKRNLVGAGAGAEAEAGAEEQTAGAGAGVDGPELLVRYNRLMEKLHYAKKMTLNYLHYDKTLQADHDFHANVDVSMFRFAPVVFDELKPFQKLIMKVMDELERLRYRRVGDMCYQQIRVHGYGTHAWAPRCTILEVINSLCHMISDYGNWLLLTTQREMDKQINEHLMRTQDPRFPVLQKNRHVFSFRNGVYFSISREALGVYSEEDGVYTNLFVAYASPEFRNLDSTIVACKFFDMDFEVTARTRVDPDIIRTPNLDGIYVYQKLSEEVIVINKMLLGRMLYDVGELDHWQVIHFLLGAGGTGKSTINNIVRTFYANEDVGILSNNHQKTFGLADIYEKFAFIAPEIKRDWNIDQAEFQEIVSGGKVSVNIKHKASVHVEWKVPGMLGGNENPGFVDNASSIQRRVVVTRFEHKVQNGDPTLQYKLEREIGAIIRQCN
eukprot:4782045-Pyramimonas_sp.AAC.1